MKFTVKVTGEAALGLPEQDFELDAADGNAAVDAVREQLSKLVPQEGGDLDVLVSAAEEWTKVSKRNGGGALTETIPPGPVSEFSFHVQPHESVRSKAEARRSDADLAQLTGAERTKERVRLLLGMLNKGEIDQALLSEALTNADRSLESLIDQAAEKEEVST